MSRIFNAKYFPNSSVLDLESKGHFSFMCKSFCWGMELVKKGLRWKIGKGNIPAFGEAWLPRAGAFRLVSPEPRHGRVWRVRDFLERGRWNRNLLESLLAPYDVQVVVSIPTSNNGGPDYLVWHYEEEGSYSVRSGYRLARQEAGLGAACSSNIIPGWWKRLWGLNIPAKIKHLMWRCWFDLLPTYGNLRRRGIDCLPFCVFCGDMELRAGTTDLGCLSAPSMGREDGRNSLRGAVLESP